MIIGAWVIHSLMMLNLSGAQAARPALVVGSPAPPIAVERWMQGTPTTTSGPAIVVLEFWATWCGPCIEAMPHLSTLQQRYGDRVHMVGVDVSDRKESPAEQQPNSPEHVARIRKWMDDNAGKMRYRVALDDAAGTMDRTWLKAAGKNTIPATFVIADGRVVWIGAPTELDGPLAAVVAGRYDLEAAIATYETELAVAAKAAALKALAQKGDSAGVERAFADYAKADPKKGVDQITAVVHALAAADPALAAPFLERRAADTYDDPTYLVMITYAVSFKAETAPAAYAALLEFSARHVERVPASSAAISYAYHALMQHTAGHLDAAKAWIARAAERVDQHEPVRTRENIRGFVKDAQVKINGGQ